MPRPNPQPDRASEVFYRDHYARADADIHEAIIAEGDHAAANTVSRAVAQRLGLSPERIDKLLGSPLKE